MRSWRRVGAAFVSVVAVLALILVCATVVINRPKSLPTGTIYTPYMLIMRGRINTVTSGQTIQIKGVLRTFTPDLKGSFHIDAEISDVQPTTGANAAIIGLGVRRGVASPLSILHQIPLIQSLAPPTADYPITGRVATYRVLLVRCITSCPLGAVWQLQDGGRPG